VFRIDMITPLKLLDTANPSGQTECYHQHDISQVNQTRWSTKDLC